MGQRYLDRALELIGLFQANLTQRLGDVVEVEYVHLAGTEQCDPPLKPDEGIVRMARPTLGMRSRRSVFACPCRMRHRVPHAVQLKATFIALSGSSLPKARW